MNQKKLNAVREAVVKALPKIEDYIETNLDAKAHGNELSWNFDQIEKFSQQVSQRIRAIIQDL
jgi:hypothetical protein